MSSKAVQEEFAEIDVQKECEAYGTHVLERYGRSSLSFHHLYLYPYFITSVVHQFMRQNAEDCGSITNESSVHRHGWG